MIDLTNLSVQFTGENLFENVNLRINKNDKIALVGSNGTGKSTLLKIIYGIEKPETGSVSRQKGIRIGYLPQEFLNFRGKSLFNEVKTAVPEITSIIDREKEILLRIEDDNLSHEEKSELLHELGDITHKKEEIDFYSFDSRIEKVLAGLGFDESDFTKKTEEFSGGWQMRIQLAKILLADNQLILLDEPTNHLDIDSLGWVIDFLKSYDGALLIISHDRYFINSVTSKTIEIYRKQVSFYNGNYEQYLVYKEEQDKLLRAQQRNIENKIRDTEKFIERFRYKATKARQVQSRIKQLEKIETVELIEEEKKIELKFPDPPRSGVVPIDAENIHKSYGDNHVIKGLTFRIERGEKIAFVGPNGAGKTTLAKILSGRIRPDTGNLIFGQNTVIAYYAQEVTEELDLEKDILDAVADTGEDLTLPQLRSALGSFLFSNDDVFKKIRVLSGGEKSRVALARLLLTKSNLIIMDEPTNHLDHSSKKILQNALLQYPGTLIIVSHDIDFLRPIVTKVLEIRRDNVQTYYGGIDYYLEKKKAAAEADIIKKENPDGQKQTKKDQKRLEAELRQKKYGQTKDLRKKISAVESEIESLENLKMEIEDSLADEKIFSNPELSRKKNLEYEKTKNDLEAKFAEWTELSDRLEEIEKQFS